MASILGQYDEIEKQAIEDVQKEEEYGHLRGGALKSAAKVARATIGMDLVPVTPLSMSPGGLHYMDYPSRPKKRKSARIRRREAYKQSLMRKRFEYLFGF